MAKKNIKINALEIDGVELEYNQEVRLETSNIDTEMYGKDTLEEALVYLQNNPILSNIESLTIKRFISNSFTIESGNTTIYRKPTFAENCIITISQDAEMHIL